MKAPAPRVAVIALSLALVGGMALTTQAQSSSSSGQQQASPMGGCCGPSQGSTGK